jgi:hypothetical protein
MLNNGEDRGNAPVKHSLTPNEWDRVRQRNVEQAEDRRLASDLNLLAAVKLGQALSRRE